VDYSKNLEESRKLQLTGGSTYIVSLPKRWISQNQLKKGSVIKVREEDGGLLSIAPSDAKIAPEREEASIPVSPKDVSDSVIRKMVSTYLIGYNMITIRSPRGQNLSTKQRYDVKNFVRHMLVGTEIVTDMPSNLALQVLLSYPELSIQSALRRMSIITTSMYKDAMTALKTLDHQLAKSVITTDDEVDRFNLYIVRRLKTAIQSMRLIKDIGLTEARDLLGYRLVTKPVERTADHAVNIAENVLLLRRRLNEEIVARIEEMSSVAISVFETAIEALFKKGFNLAESVIEKTRVVNSLEREAVTSSKKIDVEEVANLRLIIESVRRTAEYASDIAEIVLNLTVESVIWQQFQRK
jgi:phosphate uptake regulator